MVTERRKEGSGAVIPRGELHVWNTSLERAPAVVRSMYGLLAPDERDRAARFRFERDRSRYVVGRGVLRSLLGRYLARGPAEIELVYGANGKPMLASAPLFFNVTHSGPVALFAFSAQSEIGIDVELDDADFARERIAERFFSPSEVTALRSLPPALQARAFLTCWTRKEAFIKARGDGLTLPLDSFDVTLRPGSPAALLRTAWSKDEPGHWHLQDISEPEQGYIAALAIRSPGATVVKRRVPAHRDSYEEDV
jgi:4'-phosphopantetheinyl transferase